MQFRTPGNGSGGITINVRDMGGWARVFASSLDNAPPDLAVYLSDSLTNWFRDRPHLRLRCLVPRVQNGDTIELHAWYDTNIFPPTRDNPSSGHA
jgi:hypothetical protein